MTIQANARMLALAEAFALMAGTALGVLVSTDVAVAEDSWLRVVFGLGMVGTWFALLATERSSDPRILGRGFEEFRRVLLATAKLLGLVAIVLLLTGVPLPRQTLLIALASGLGLCLLAHLVNSAYLRRRRAIFVAARTRVLLVGTAQEADRVAAAISGDAKVGYTVVGFHPFMTRTRAKEVAGGMLTLLDEDPKSDLEQIVGMARRHEATAVIITSAERMGDGLLRDLRWALHRHDIDLMVLPDVACISQPKLSVEQLGTLSLLRVNQPGYSSVSGFGKAAFDKILSILLLVMASPILLAIAVAVKFEDGGPVFYRPDRVGMQGTHFRMWKFRSMQPDAEARLAEVRALSGLSDAAFYKWAEDPRITRVGRFLRATSLDELPQLFNVVTGEMSLIGPRPMVDGEGEEFPDFVQRRLSVKPGMTGLWQVSGRSDLSEQERVRLDLHYVENWSVDQDLRILFRTAATVIERKGAY